MKNSNFALKIHIHHQRFKFKISMKRHFLPEGIGIAMTKSQFCFSTGCTPYRLKQAIANKAETYKRLGLHKYDKLLMPNVVQQLLSDTGLRIDMGYYIQYIQGQRGNETPLITE